MQDQNKQSRIDAIFLGAAELPADQRSQFLAEQCEALGDDVRRQIEELLENDDIANSIDCTNPFFNLVGLAKETKAYELEDVGTSVGRYRLLERLGEGGMGVVYMAEQTEPVRRRVALKVIKPGLDTKQAIARFEAERQALAMMEHPNIAKVLDVGATESGRPYFVMELVMGVPITKYCKQRRLTVEERLNLFVTVCLAVQHSHQKGIIHRDLKPSNVLVARYDEVGVPKVIDFGLAKALHHPLTDKTLFTNFGQMVGTFEYMSPEQTHLNQLDVDTRTDIYSLGVLLHEMLTGCTPLDVGPLQKVAFDEVLRLIRLTDPPVPSSRLSRNASIQLSLRPARRTLMNCEACCVETLTRSS